MPCTNVGQITPAQISLKNLLKPIDNYLFPCYNTYIRDEGKHQKTRKATAMSKMMNVNVNSYLSNETPTKKAIARIKVANKLIEILEDRVPRSLREIETIILENMTDEYLNSTSVKSILNWFELSNLITTEIRKEEFITIKTKDYIYRDVNNNVIPQKVTVTYNGYEVCIDNPEFKKHRFDGKWEEIEKQVQVQRKYYTWVA